MRFDYLFLGQLWYDTSIFPPLDFNKDQWSRKCVTLVRLKRTKTSHPKLLQIQRTKQLYKFPKISHIKKKIHCKIGILFHVNKTPPN